jgi:hypothetical protein
LKDMLNKYGMEDAKPLRTHMTTNGHFGFGWKMVVRLIKSNIGLWLEAYSTWQHQDQKSCLVCVCARFQASPKECHLSAVKRISRYLKHILPMLVCGILEMHNLSLLYSDSNYVECKVDSKSISDTSISRDVTCAVILEETKFCRQRPRQNTSL